MILLQGIRIAKMSGGFPLIIFKGVGNDKQQGFLYSTRPLREGKKD